MVNSQQKGFELPKLRSWNEFIFADARYGLFDYKNVKKWNNRMISNLLYYQTNYFVLIAIITIIGFLFNPKAVLIGNTLIYGQLTAIVAFKQHQRLQLNSHYLLSAIGLLLLLIIVCRTSVVYSLFFACLSIFLPMIHASIRLRTIQNRAMNFIGNQKSTVMGILLETVLNFDLSSLIE